MITSQSKPQIYKFSPIFLLIHSNAMKTYTPLPRHCKIIPSIIYQWKYPATLLITRKDSTSSLITVEGGHQLLRAWDVLPSTSAATSSVLLSSGWQVVSHKWSGNRNHHRDWGTWLFFLMVNPYSQVPQLLVLWLSWYFYPLQMLQLYSP